ncbi:hypothetical protein N0V83_007664 [Neocucurbitaria cava]|uniref:Uncharacterized protein n=1 Tax=Neocucurbitaria cava TaxID=798079 RepID=A0A9W8Y3Q0_9PLEO|nr:hypothetical protein N0V83_007664 [Neocucurbitaria cava]
MRFFRRHYFQVSFMGLGFVREIIDTYFRKEPFRILHHELFTGRGNQEFFLIDKFGLGCPVGQLLQRVEVTITSIDLTIWDQLQPLMAIGNTDCAIELTSPTQLVTHDHYGQENPISAKEFLDKIALNVRRMTMKGYYITVRYEGEIIYTANDPDDKSRVSTEILTVMNTANRSRTNQCQSRKPSRVVNRPKPAALHKQPAKPAAQDPKLPNAPTRKEHGVPQPANEPPAGSKSVLKQHPVHPKIHQNHHGDLMDEDPKVPPKSAAPQPAVVCKLCGADVKTELPTTVADVARAKRTKRDGERPEDIKAFYEKRRAEVRALLAARQR